SRESFLLMNNVLLVAATGLILLGTTYPMFMDLFNLGKISVGPPYFTVMFLVPMLPLAFLLPHGMHAGWKNANLAHTGRLLLILLAVSAVLALALVLLNYGWHSVLSWIGFLLAFWIGASALIEPVNRWRKGHSLSVEMLGMCIAHFGVALFILGATGV